MILLGDAMNMRHPLTGGGMTVGLNDVVLLCELLSPKNVPRLDSTKLVLKQLKSFHWKRKDITAVINILAQALYALFAANGKFVPLLVSTFIISSFLSYGNLHAHFQTPTSKPFN
jgi:2-polyprenyl-6-methoxyphenol hydroxylase-like FAD-dependent oxidoreductase